MTVNNELAEMYGLKDAIVLHFLATFCAVNFVNQSNIHNGQTWVKASVNTISTKYIPLTYSETRYALQRLLEKNILKKANLNDPAFLRTLSYTFTSEEIFQEVFKLVAPYINKMDKFQNMNIKDITLSQNSSQNPDQRQEKANAENKNIQETNKQNTEQINIYEQLKNLGLYPGQIEKIKNKNFNDDYLILKIEQHDFVKKYFHFRMKPKGTKEPNPAMYLFNSIMHDWIDKDFAGQKDKEDLKAQQEEDIKIKALQEEEYKSYLSTQWLQLFNTLSIEEKKEIEIEAESRYTDSIKILTETFGQSENMLAQDKRNLVKGHIADIINQKYSENILTFKDFCEIPRKNE